MYVLDGANATFSGCLFEGNNGTKGHNDITRGDNTSNVTFACAIGEVGAPVSMKAGELEMSKPPPTSLNCTKPIPPPKSHTAVDAEIVGIASAAVLLLLVFLYYRRGRKNRTSTEESTNMLRQDAASRGTLVQAYNEAVLSGTQTVTWAKLMFIGQGRAGKTSLLRNLTKQGFQADESVTDGADVCIINNSV